MAKKPRVYRRYRKSYAPKSRRVNDFASLSETIRMTASLPAVPPTDLFLSQTVTGPVFTMSDQTLVNYVRATAVAQGYQFFRIKYFEVSFLPSADTFVNGVNSPTKPFLYYMIDKGDAIPDALTNVQIKQLGAKPIALDEKPVHVRWSPAVTLSTEINTSTGSTSAQKYLISPWLNVDEDPTTSTYQPSQVVHNGLKFCVETGIQQIPYSATITAHFQFKKPNVIAYEQPSSN